MRDVNHQVLLQQAIQQARNGQKRAAAHNLALVLRADPEQVEAWLWLSACVDTREKQIYCLRQALRIDAENLAARRGLEELEGSAATRPVPVTGRAASTPAPASEDAGTALETEGGETRPASPWEPTGGEASSATATPGEKEPVYEVHGEAPVEVVRQPARAVWLVLGALLIAAIGLNWLAQRNRAGGDGRPFELPAGQYASVETRIGPGDDLAAAIRGAPDGGVVYLQAGTYPLDETIEITRAIEIRGAGMNASRIHSQAAGAVLLIRTAGRVKLTEVEILYSGTGAADGVVVESGQLVASGVRLGGARREGESGGRGLLLKHESGAEVSGSELLDNDRAGIEVRGAGSVVLRQNAVHDNGQYGILIAGNASPKIQANEVTQNGKAGIRLEEDARGEVRDNRLDQNSESGISLDGSAAPLVFANSSEGNGVFGIEVRGAAAPILMNNTARRNGKAGLGYFDRAAGAAESNDCSENELHGISVNQNASPFLRENRCNQNRQVGIDYWGNSGGTAANNQCSENGLQGIAVHENALPVLQNNACLKNSDSGIIYWDEAGGTASNNECSENQINGISVHDQAAPALLKNSCRSNQGNGIVFFDRAGGEARENECANNGTDGIDRPQGAKIVLQGNRCGGQ